jgi:ribose 5-phosphate isomerase B
MIFIAGDKYGVELIALISEWLKRHDKEFSDLGAQSATEELLLTEMIPKVADNVKDSVGNSGIMVCGTGVGIDIGANRFRGIRAALANTPRLAEWARKKDNANVLCLSGWEEWDEAKVDELLKAWFNTSYDGSPARLEMLKTFDEWS